MGLLSFFRRDNTPVLPLINSMDFASSFPDDYIILDLETTGLDPSSNEILEIAAIKYHLGVEVDLYHTYIQPIGKIPPEITEINGITYSTVYGSPSLSDIANDFLHFISGHTLLGYNIPFDMAFLQTRLQRQLSNHLIDVLPIAQQCFPTKNHKLETLKNFLQLPYKSHSALEDCRTTYKVLSYCLPYISLNRAPSSLFLPLMISSSNCSAFSDASIDIFCDGTLMSVLEKKIHRSIIFISGEKHTLLFRAHIGTRLIASKEIVIDCQNEGKHSFSACIGWGKPAHLVVSLLPPLKVLSEKSISPLEEHK